METTIMGHIGFRVCWGGMLGVQGLGGMQKKTETTKRAI